MQIMWDALGNTHPEEWVGLLIHDKEILLEIERQQLIEAGNICGNMLIANDIVITGDHNLSVGENYYNQTYNK